MNDPQERRAPWTVLTSRTVLLASTLVAAAEVLLRALGGGGGSLLPPSRVYYSDHVEPRLQALNETLREEGRVDVLFVGSSVVRTNFRPLLFDSVAEAVADQEVISFNGGLSGLPPAAVRFYLDRFFLNRIEPSFVFQGIRLPELLRSEPVDQVEALAKGVVEPLWMDSTPWSDAMAWSFENLALLRYRGLLGRSLRARRFPPRWPFTYEIDRRGWNRRDSTVVERLTARAIEPLAPYPDALDRAAMHRGLEILRLTSEDVRARGIEYVLVNVPEHGLKHQGASATTRYQEYLAALSVLAEEQGILFIDPTGGDPSAFQRDAWYYDGHHMTVEGARRFTVEVARAWRGPGPSP